MLIPAARRGARPAGRHGRRRCRRASSTARAAMPRPMATGSRAFAARAVGRDRSMAPGGAEVAGGRRRSRRPTPISRGTRPSRRSSPGTIPETRRRGSTWRSSATRRRTSGARPVATERAVATAGFLEAELINAALSYEALGAADAADAAYRRSLLSQRLTAFALDWPRDVPIGDATLEDDFGALLELNRLLAWWAMDEPIDAASIADPATRALAHAMRGERSEAEEWLERAIDTAPDSIATWDVAIVLRDHWGLPIDRRARDRRGRSRRAVPRPRRAGRRCRGQTSTSRRSGPIRPTDSSARRSASARARRTPGSSSGPSPSRARRAAGAGSRTVAAARSAPPARSGAAASPRRPRRTGNGRRAGAPRCR